MGTRCLAMFSWKEGRSKGSVFAGCGIGSGGLRQGRPWEKVVRIWGWGDRNQGKLLFPGKYKDNGRQGT